MSQAAAIAADLRLQQRIAGFKFDPVSYVIYNFPWGVKGTSLEHFDGPDQWQRDELKAIGDYQFRVAKKELNLPPYRLSVASGHGSGKTALIAWIIKWFMSCYAHPQIPVTANTMEQLNAKTWRELAKWNKLGLDGEWFEWTATRFYKRTDPETWFASAIPWSENNAEAFAGTHDKHVLVAMDEASRISDSIHNVVDGAMSTYGAMWIMFGNPTKTAGRFYESHHAQKKFWRTRNVDCRTTKMASRVWCDQMIEMYGETSDRVKVQVLGQFPSQGFRQLVSAEAVAKAQATTLEPEVWAFEPLIAGLDVARFGDCETVLQFRQGRKCFEPIVIPNGDLMTTAAHVAGYIKARMPVVTIVDEIGVGAGVLDRLRQLGHSAIGGNSGNMSDDPRFLNKRAQAYMKLKEYVEALCELPPDKMLAQDLLGLSYDFTDKGRLRLDRKQDFIDEYGRSPDRADALALTFYYEYGADHFTRADLEPQCFEDGI